jgi:O-antigen/teichoic acid export membrane protein
MIGTRRLFRRFLSLLGPRVLATFIAVVSTPIVVRLLGAGHYGDYAVLLSIYSMYMIPISAAITEGVQKFVGEDRDADDWVERVLQFYLVLAVGLALVGSAALVVATRLGVADTFGEGFTFYFYVLAAFVVVGQVRGLSMHTVLGFGLEHVKGPLSVVKKLTTVVVGLTLVVSGLGVVGMLLGHIAANALVAFVGAYVVARRISVRRLLGLPTSMPYREFLSFNVLNVALVFLVMSLFHVDVVMVRALVGDETTGYYKAALALAEYIWIVPIVLQSLLLHSTSTLWSDGRTAEITALASQVTRYTALLVLLMAVGIGTLAHRFVPLYYGESFAASTVPLLLLLPGAVGFAVARPLQAICQGSGELKPLILAVSAAAVLNVVLNAALIPRFGMNGAATATSTAYGSMFLLLVAVARHLGCDPLVDLRAGRIAAAVAATAAVIVAVDRLIVGDVVALLVVPPTGFCVFTGATLLTGALDVEEVVEILDQLPLPFEVPGEPAG